MVGNEKKFTNLIANDKNIILNILDILSPTYNLLISRNGTLFLGAVDYITKPFNKAFLKI
jgi:hypothetical protein